MFQKLYKEKKEHGEWLVGILLLLFEQFPASDCETRFTHSFSSTASTLTWNCTIIDLVNFALIITITLFFKAKFSLLTVYIFFECLVLKSCIQIQGFRCDEGKILQTNTVFCRLGMEQPAPMPKWSSDCAVKKAAKKALYLTSTNITMWCNNCRVFI